MPIITTRIKNFLTESLRNNEFAHTVLHNKIIIDPKPIKMTDIKNVSEDLPPLGY